MKKVDVIDKYLEAKALGDSEEKAQLFARSWAESMELRSDLITKKDLDIALESFMAKLESRFSSINSRFVILTMLGGFIYLTVFAQYFQKLFSH